MVILIVIWGIIAAYIVQSYEFVYYNASLGKFLLIVHLLIIAAPALLITNIVFFIFDLILPEGWNDIF